MLIGGVLLAPSGQYSTNKASCIVFSKDSNVPMSRDGLRGKKGVTMIY